MRLVSTVLSLIACGVLPATSDLGLPSVADGEAALDALFAYDLQDRSLLPTWGCAPGRDPTAGEPPRVEIPEGRILGTRIVPGRPASPPDPPGSYRMMMSTSVPTLGEVDQAPDDRLALLRTAWLHVFRDDLVRHGLDARQTTLFLVCRDAGDPNGVLVQREPYGWSRISTDMGFASTCDQRCTLFVDAAP